MKASEAIKIIGKDLYGETFSIEEAKLKSTYKKVYEIFLTEKKGVLLIGSIGIGKSALMRVFHRMFKDTDRKFKWVSGLELKDLSETMTVGEIKNLYGYGLKCDLYIDDIGFTIDVKRYGNTVNIISEIIMDRYELFISSGFKTHLSSNIAPFSTDNTVSTIDKIYGSRVLDRIKEISELVSWSGTSLRK